MSNIKAIRARLGLTQLALARGLGCTQGNIGHYENKGQVMPPEVARRLIGYAKSLGQDLSFDDIYAEPLDAAQEVQVAPSISAPSCDIAADDGDWGVYFDQQRDSRFSHFSAQGAAGQPADPALNVELVRAEQAGLVKLPKPAPQWDGVERRAPAPRQAVGRSRDSSQAGQGV